MNTLKLPEDYKEVLSVDLANDKKTWALLNGSHILILITGLFMGHKLFPDIITIRTILNQNYFLFMIANFIQIGIHELIHGLFIKITSGFKVDYGFSLSYAFAGNKLAYFDKKSYLVIAMSPAILIGSFIHILLMTLPDSYFLFFFMLQLLNIGGGVGDYYVSYLTLKMPDNTLVNDSGTIMTFYSKA